MSKQKHDLGHQKRQKNILEVQRRAHQKRRPRNRKEEESSEWQQPLTWTTDRRDHR